MKMDSLILIGGLGILAYFLLKKSGDGLLGGGGGVPLGIGDITLPLISEGYTTPSSYVVRHYRPTTTVVKRVGGRTYAFQSSGGNQFGMITVGTPTQQIEQYSTGPKVIKVNGRTMKVM